MAVRADRRGRRYRRRVRGRLPDEQPRPPRARRAGLLQPRLDLRSGWPRSTSTAGRRRASRAGWRGSASSPLPLHLLPDRPSTADRRRRASAHRTEPARLSGSCRSSNGPSSPASWPGHSRHPSPGGEPGMSTTTDSGIATEVDLSVDLGRGLVLANPLSGRVGHLWLRRRVRRRGRRQSPRRDLLQGHDAPLAHRQSATARDRDAGRDAQLDRPAEPRRRGRDREVRRSLGVVDRAGDRQRGRRIGR